MTTSSDSSVQAAIAWLEAKAEGGEVNRTTAKLQISAANALIAALREDEDHSVRNVLALLPDLGRRWTNLNPEKHSATAATYITRARGLLEQRLAWLDDPVGHRFPEGRSARKASTPKAGPSTAKAKEPTGDSPSQEKPANEQTIGFRLPLGNGRFIKTEFPPDISRAEVMRHFWVMVGYAHDFDPSESRGDFFPIVKAG